MPIIRKIFLLFVLLFPVLYALPQASVTISEYGVYFIDEGVVKKLPIEAHVSDPRFWRNYIVFSGAYSNFLLVYNIENGAISDTLPPGPLYGGRFPFENSNENLLFYLYGMEYELHPVTLRTINSYSTTRPRDDRPILPDWDSRWYGAEWVNISEYLHRFQGKNYYFDVTLTQNIDPWKIQNILYSETNRFVLIIDDRYDGGR